MYVTADVRVAYSLLIHSIYLATKIQLVTSKRHKESEQVTSWRDPFQIAQKTELQAQVAVNLSFVKTTDQQFGNKMCPGCYHTT